MTTDLSPARPEPTVWELLLAAVAVRLFWRRYRLRYTGRRLAGHQDPKDRAPDGWSPLDDDVRRRLAPTLYDGETTDLRRSMRKAVAR